MLRHRGTCDGDRAFQSLKNGTGIPYAFFVSGRLTAARQETLATFFFILFGCAAVISLSPAIYVIISFPPLSDSIRLY